MLGHEGLECRSYDSSASQSWLIIPSAQKDSPLIIGLSEHEQLFSSDIPTPIAYTRQIVLILDKKSAVLEEC